MNLRDMCDDYHEDIRAVTDEFFDRLDALNGADANFVVNAMIGELEQIKHRLATALLAHELNEQSEGEAH